ncbi:hypothetical protein B0H14DRAFT_2606265 [Mycena olivaceomarginata]|nr:hypothetical protein B0H14DRAFT_2606265 [Mycena olivaceomarginata]
MSINEKLGRIAHPPTLAWGRVLLRSKKNCLQLIKKACRLSTTQYFLEQFITAARQQDVDIEKDIEVTEFKLGVEVIKAGAGPSIASGFSLEQYKAVYEDHQESTVLADIQSATAIKADARVVLVIMENPASRPSFKNMSVGTVADISVSVVMGFAHSLDSTDEEETE